MNISNNSYGSYGSPYSGGYDAGLSDDETQAGYRNLNSKKRKDGLINSMEKAEAENTNGKKTTTDTIRLS